MKNNSKISIQAQIINVISSRIHKIVYTAYLHVSIVPDFGICNEVRKWLWAHVGLPSTEKREYDATKCKKEIMEEKVLSWGWWVMTGQSRHVSKIIPMIFQETHMGTYYHRNVQIPYVAIKFDQNHLLNMLIFFIQHVLLVSLSKVGGCGVWASMFVSILSHWSINRSIFSLLLLIK